jgi:diaminopimelate epimerase
MISFKKMHGLGNDFVVLDARAQKLDLSPARLRSIANRKTGIGCDQVIILDAPKDKSADIYMRIINADGTEVNACGNATRCVAWELGAEKKQNHITIQTGAGLLECDIAGDHMVTVDMGAAQLDWRDIPLRDACDTAEIPIELPGSNLPKPVGVNVGNPHAVFFIANAESFDVAKWGPQIETHKMFPQKTNVEFVQILDRSRVRMRVWERGAGITDACGTGACAAAVAAVRKNLTDRKITVVMDGGELQIEYLRDGHVLMTGPVAIAFVGEWRDAA